MATVVIAPFNVVNFPEGGGHFWVYLQYALGLSRLGCEVYWLEALRSSGDQARDASVLSTFLQRMERYGLGGKLVLYKVRGKMGTYGEPPEYVGMTRSEAEAVFRRAD